MSGAGKRGGRRVAAVVLAAGSSNRMGEDKLLLQFGGRAMLDITISLLLAGEADDIVVVLKHGPASTGARQHLSRMKEPRVRIAENPKPERGMRSSLACGLRALAGESPRPEIILMALADQPLVKAGTMSKLLGAVEKGSLIAIPRYHGKKGHPVAFAWKVAREFMSPPEDGEVREIFWKHSAETALLDVDDEGVVLDVDTPGDYERAKKKGGL